MFKYLFAALAVSSSSFVLAEGSSEQKVRGAIQSMVPTASIDSVAKSIVPGFYEVVLGGNVIYVSADGKYLMQGRVYDVDKKLDLTESKQAGLRKASLNSIGADKRIVFAAKNPKHTVTIFTDIDCGYCRKLHQEIAQYNNLGISVEYLFFPRAGIGSGAFDEAVSVWCAADKNKAMTDAKAGKSVDKKTCPNPVAETYNLGQKVGVTGTPAVIAKNGTMIGGYVPPTEMLVRLDALNDDNVDP